MVLMNYILLESDWFIEMWLFFLVLYMGQLLLLLYLTLQKNSAFYKLK